MKNPISARKYAGRDLSEVSRFACSITAIAHVISRPAAEVYDGMRRDMSVRYKGDICGYIPSEMTTYLFERHWSCLPVDFGDQDDLPAHMLGVPKERDVMAWMRDRRRCLIGYQYGEFGHWVGYDGFMVNNLRVLGGESDQSGWDDFVSNYQIDEYLYGRLRSGPELIPRMAILVA